MGKRLLVATLIASAAILAWGVSASTQEASGGATGEAVPVEITLVNEERAQLQQAQLEEQAQLQQARLVEHHAKLLDLMRRVEKSQLDYQARVARQLGDRAPKETMSPLATISPMETASPMDD